MGVLSPRRRDGKNEDMEFSERAKMRKEQSGKSRRGAMSNPKSQASKPKQIPNPNVQIPNQPRYLVWNLGLETCLGFDA
jgi:hypothetical protein